MWFDLIDNTTGQSTGLFAFNTQGYVDNSTVEAISEQLASWTNGQPTYYTSPNYGNENFDFTYQYGTDSQQYAESGCIPNPLSATSSTYGLTDVNPVTHNTLQTVSQPTSDSTFSLTWNGSN
jgi:hypothetical protein